MYILRSILRRIQTGEKKKEINKVFLELNMIANNKMNIPQTALAILLVILGTLILCQSQSSRRESQGGNFLEESDIEDDYIT